MDLSPPAVPGPPDIGRVENDLACVECGYALRSIGLDARCPECNTKVSVSLLGNRLEHCGRAYVSGLARGGTLVATGIALGLVSVLIDVFRTLTWPAWAWVTAVQPWGVTLPADVLSLVGWWWLTALDPGYVGPDAAKLRRAIRISVLVTAIGTFVSDHSDWLGVRAPGGTAGYLPYWLPQLASGVTLLSYVVRFFVGLIYCRWLAKRIPESRISPWTLRMLWLGPALMVPLAGAGALVATRWKDPRADPLGEILVVSGGLIAGALYLALILRLTRAIRRVRYRTGPPPPAAEHR